MILQLHFLQWFFKERPVTLSNGKATIWRIKCTVTNASSLMNSDLSYVSIYPFFGQVGPDYHPLDLRPLTTQGKLNKPETRGGGPWKRGLILLRFLMESWPTSFIRPN